MPPGAGERIWEGIEHLLSTCFMLSRGHGLQLSMQWTQHSYFFHSLGGKMKGQREEYISHSLEQVWTQIVSIIQANAHPHMLSCPHPSCLPGTVSWAGMEINRGLKRWGTLPPSRSSLLLSVAPQGPTFLAQLSSNLRTERAGLCPKSHSKPRQG